MCVRGHWIQPLDGFIIVMVLLMDASVILEIGQKTLGEVQMSEWMWSCTMHASARSQTNRHHRAASELVYTCMDVYCYMGGCALIPSIW